jgi:flagellar M-ring protein FliF
MQLDSSQILKQGRTFLAGLSAGQRKMLGGGTAAAVIGTVAFLLLMGRGDYKPLYTGLTRDQANSMVHHLAEDNIPAQLSSDGTGVLVAENNLDKGRLDMASEGLPQSGRLGFEIFDKPNWAGSDFSEQVNYQRALEGELERTILSLSDVEAVRVNLVLPHHSLFTDQERPAKASVLVKLRGSQLSDRSLNAITYLVASAVDTLKPENVTVVDASNGVPILVHGAGLDGGPPGAQKLETGLENKILNTLSPVVGADHVIAKVTVEYQHGTQEETDETYDPKDQVALTSEISAQGGSGYIPDQGVPGPASNVPAGQPQPVPAATGKSNSPASSSTTQTVPSGITMRNETYAVGKTVRHMLRPAGGIKRITAAVLVDDVTETQTSGGKSVQVRRKRTPEELKEIETLAAASIGLNPQRGDTIAVEEMPFQQLQVKPPQPPKGLQKFAPMLKPYSGVAHYLGILLIFLMVYLLILKPIVRQVVASMAGSSVQEMAGPQLELAGPGGSLGPGQIAGALPDGTRSGDDQEKDEHQGVRALRDIAIDSVEKQPAEASKIIESWIRERRN